MKAICTTYTETNNGLVLRNNWVDSLMDYDLKEYLMPYTDDLEYLNHYNDSIKKECKSKSFSSVFEGKMSLDNVVIHIRFIS